MNSDSRLWSFVGIVVALLWLNRRSVAGISIDALAEAIGYVESRGNYQAIGPVTQDGHRAYGKYQVLDSNIGAWTTRALGIALTPAEFLADHDAQDITARDTIGRVLAQYGNPADVASVWFSGLPLGSTGAQQDVTGTTVPQYVQAVLARL